MTALVRIDFVSDVSCPWCVVGLLSLEQALARLDDVTAEIRFQPFELNPGMGPEGQNIVEHIGQKYGSTPAQSAQARERIRAHGEALGFEFRMTDESRIYNTFDAHRLLHWAGVEGRQAALKHALFKAYFTDGRDPSDRASLAKIAGEAGLDAERARDVLDSGLYAREVREAEARYRASGVNAVPAVILNERYLISGGQPVEVFEQALRQVAAQSADGPPKD